MPQRPRPPYLRLVEPEKPPSLGDELPREIPLLLGSRDPSWSATLAARRNAWTFDPVIRTKAGTVMDYDRAVLLLDKTLVQETFQAMGPEPAPYPGWGLRHGAQSIWDDYCRRHLEKYGEPFAPDVIPGWDHFPTPEKD
jgi:hypothetical protein